MRDPNRARCCARAIRIGCFARSEIALASPNSSLRSGGTAHARGEGFASLVVFSTCPWTRSTRESRGAPRGCSKLASSRRRSDRRAPLPPTQWGIRRRWHTCAAGARSRSCARCWNERRGVTRVVSEPGFAANPKRSGCAPEVVKIAAREKLGWSAKRGSRGL